jgi:hypothetical protein
MKIDNTNVGAGDTALDQGISPKRPKLKLDRQVIRTLTGDELQMIGGGGCKLPTCAVLTLTIANCGILTRLSH